MQSNSELGLRHRTRGREDGKGKGGKTEKSLSMNSLAENIFSLLISTQYVAFRYTDFYTTLCFENQRNYETLAIQTHALTRTKPKGNNFTSDSSRKDWVSLKEETIPKT
jgi:hypothetical protein